jgi:hypothetical protein
MVAPRLDQERALWPLRYDALEILLGLLLVAKGRVVGPGAAGELAPGDSGLGAQPEQVGHDGGRELAGELQERGLRIEMHHPGREHQERRTSKIHLTSQTATPGC